MGELSKALFQRDSCLKAKNSISQSNHMLKKERGEADQDYRAQEAQQAEDAVKKGLADLCSVCPMGKSELLQSSPIPTGTV